MKLNEKTPESLLCILGNCPAVFETDRDTYVVIGKQITSNQASELLKERIGNGEIAVEFPKELLNTILKENQ
jgi:hypothetical protein